MSVFRNMGMWWFAVMAAAVIPAGPAAAASDEMPKKALYVLSELSRQFAAMESFQVHYTTRAVMVADGVRQELTAEYFVAAKRPNKFLIRFKRGVGMAEGLTLVSDGKKLVIYVALLNRYVVRDAPKTLADMAKGEVRDMMHTTGVEGAGFFMALLSKDPLAELVKGVNSGRYVGLTKMRNTACFKLSFEQDAFDWDLWAVAGRWMLPLKIRQDYTKSMSAMVERGEAVEGMRRGAVLYFNDWIINGKIPKELFDVSMPPSAEKVASFYDVKSELIGKPAPRPELKLLDGGALELDRHADADIVVLTFWESGFPLSIKAVSVVSRTVAGLTDEGVVFYAINQKQKPKEIGKIMKMNRLDCNMVLDPEAKATKAYGVSVLPQTFLIGRDGNVKATYIGLLPDLAERIEKDVETLLSAGELESEDQ